MQVNTALKRNKSVRLKMRILCAKGQTFMAVNVYVCVYGEQSVVADDDE